MKNVAQAKIRPKTMEQMLFMNSLISGSVFSLLRIPKMNDGTEEIIRRIENTFPVPRMRFNAVSAASGLLEKPSAVNPAKRPIIRKIEKLSVARPMTHDLIISIVDKTGYKLDRIEINDVEKETYYATLFLTKGDDVIEIDSRPSDAIAVAMRAEAPIFVTANVLMNGSVSTDSARDEEEAEEFKDFIQSVKPSDFEKLIDKHRESDQ